MSRYAERPHKSEKNKKQKQKDNIESLGHLWLCGKSLIFSVEAKRVEPQAAQALNVILFFFPFSCEIR